MVKVKHILALDVGEKRVGVAIANVVARLPRPLTTLERSDRTVQEIARIVQSEDAETIVVGLPRGLKGQDTAQTEAVRSFVRQLDALHIQLVWQDEALTSVKAEQELRQTRDRHSKADVDALAATYILEDYLNGEENTYV